MRKLLLGSTGLAALLAGPATAADFAVKAPPPVMTYSWTGCHAGVHAGAGWGLNDWSLNGQPLGVLRVSGFLRGAQVGCDYQVGAGVFGIEGQYAWANLNGQLLAAPPITSGVLISGTSRIATATGRAGYAFDQVLPYVKAGFGWDRSSHEFDSTSIPTFLGGAELVGVVVGAGVEVAFLSNWSWKIEYDYLSLGSNGINLTCLIASCGVPQGTPLPFDIKQNVQSVIFGLNFRIGPATLAARY